MGFLCGTLHKWYYVASPPWSSIIPNAEQRTEPAIKCKSGKAHTIDRTAAGGVRISSQVFPSSHHWVGISKLLHSIAMHRFVLSLVPPLASNSLVECWTMSLNMRPLPPNDQNSNCECWSNPWNFNLAMNYLNCNSPVEWRWMWFLCNCLEGVVNSHQQAVGNDWNKLSECGRIIFLW